MSKGKKTEIEKLTEASRDVIAGQDKAIEELASKAEAEEANERALYEIGLKIGTLFSRIENKPNSRLFQRLQDVEHDPPSTVPLDVGGVEIQVVSGMDSIDLYGAIRIMVDTMERQKDEIGYKAFIEQSGEMEFMFFLSFFTDVGFHSTLESYMHIHEVFSRVGVLDKFYEIIGESRQAALKVFERVYDLWKEEHLIMLSSAVFLGSPVTLLSKRMYDMFGEDDIAGGLLDVPDIQNAVLGALLGAEGKGRGVEKKAPDITQPIFQKREISGSKPNLVVLNSDNEDTEEPGDEG